MKKLILCYDYSDVVRNTEDGVQAVRYTDVMNICGARYYDINLSRKLEDELPHMKDYLRAKVYDAIDMAKTRLRPLNQTKETE